VQICLGTSTQRVSATFLVVSTQTVLGTVEHRGVSTVLAVFTGTLWQIWSRVARWFILSLF
jgi:hypothetical protein